jgi:hypothetical protein
MVALVFITGALETHGRSTLVKMMHGDNNMVDGLLVMAVKNSLLFLSI